MEHIKNFNEILTSFNIKAQCVDYKELGNYSYYDLKLKLNVKIKDVQKYAEEISLALKMSAKPNIKIMHSLGIVRLEFVSPRTEKLNLFDFFTNDNVPEGELICLLGQSLDGKKMWMNLADNPHMIIAGTTGSGKSTLLHNIIANVFNYNHAHLYLVDPKNIEFAEYGKSFGNRISVSYSYTEASLVLDSLLKQMEDRFEAIRNGVSKDTMPYSLLIIDEFADLIMQDNDNSFYDKLCRLAQKCRAAKISIILATQRPSVDIVSGTIKANFPARIACKVATHVDSKVVLDAVGAQYLLGRGDALVRDNTRFLERFQIAFTSPEEICKVFGNL